MKNVSRIASAAAMAGGLVLATGPAQALVKWNFVNANCVTCNNASRTWNAFEATAGETPGTVTATGWANTGGATNNLLRLGDVTDQGSSGIGVRNADAGQTGNTETSSNGEHAVDNIGRYDLVLFHFQDSVSISEVGIGWFSEDADISLLAWEGAGAPNIDGATYSATAQSLTGPNAWTLIGNFDVDTVDGGVGGGDAPDQGDGNLDFVQAINTNVSSSYWIVGAYNPVFAAGPNEGNESDANSPPNMADKVKLLSLAGTIKGPPDTGVTEPTSLLLLAGVLPFVRRRRGTTT